MMETAMECSDHRLRLVRPGGREVPCNLPMERVWRWCIVSSLRDVRRSKARERVISLPAAKRLFARRWAEACRLHDLAESAEERSSLRMAGEGAVEEGYQRLCRAWWGDVWTY